MARTIAEYHQLLVEPRLAYLESWWWQKLWVRTKQLYRWTLRLKPAPVTPKQMPPDSISFDEMEAAMESITKEQARPTLDD